MGGRTSTVSPAHTSAPSSGWRGAAGDALGEGNTGNPSATGCVLSCGHSFCFSIFTEVLCPAVVKDDSGSQNLHTDAQVSGEIEFISR